MKILLMGSLSLVCAVLLSSSAARAQSSGPALDARIQSILEKSMPRFACNLSPTKWKKKVERVVDGKVEWVEIEAAKGSIIAAPHLSDPDYFFHWNRDSALVVAALVRYMPFIAGQPQEERLHDFIRDFIFFSSELQRSPTPHGLGEVRFNVDGSVDTIPWSRPQNDGPALRAMTLMAYAKAHGHRLAPETSAELMKVVLTDLDYIAVAFRERSFDLWEYSIGHHFYTRMVQLGALEEALRTYPGHARSSWRQAIDELKVALKGHWNEEKEFYSFSVGPVFDQPGNPAWQPGGGLDTSVVFAATHSHRKTKTLSFRDEKLQYSAFKLEKFFRSSFPLNANPLGQLGPAMGRHEGDGYYGGNAFFFLTAGYAEQYFLLADFYRSNPGEELVVSRFNQELFEELLGKKLKLGKNLMTDKADRTRLLRKFKQKGEAFLETILANVRDDGMMAEQFNKVDGGPASATDLTWSYSSLLSAVLAREEIKRSTLDLSRIDFTCR